MKSMINNGLSADINRVLSDNKNGNDKMSTATLEIITDAGENRIETFVSIDTVADYIQSFTDVISVNFILPTGEYTKCIHPYKDNLIARITKKVGDMEFLQYYKMLIYNTDDNFDMGEFEEESKEKLNTDSFIEIKAQCVNSKAFVMSKYTLSGILNNINLRTVMLAKFKECMFNSKLNGEPINIPINIEPLDNNKLNNDIVIETGTKIFDFPKTLQNGDYGLYNGGIGTYLTRVRRPVDDSFKFTDSIFIYSPLSNSKVNMERKRLILYASPSGVADLIDVTHADSVDKLELVISDNLKIRNATGNLDINNSAGYSSVKAEDAMMGNVEIRNGAIATKNKDVSNTMGRSRKDGLNTRANVGVNSNEFKIRSELTRNNGKILQINWTFAVPEYLIPNMPVTLYYTSENDVVKEANGKLLMVTSSTNLDSQTTNAILYIFINKENTEDESDF